jgi:hypothetical protein
MTGNANKSSTHMGRPQVGLLRDKRNTSRSQYPFIFPLTDSVVDSFPGLYRFQKLRAASNILRGAIG